ncbi:membrane protein insertase YidC [Agaricicola taiwanensis]|uniref:Membrane protein insertase YidC n=1 Tax=Agaricicola taiwanensis TaxID=591372 RepID=A0A8J2VMW8_9RHOB|nr:membrane protein insertase YidC [Agaricicola taiwanensis]GGE33502.1 membrane protein insertase YidC [Agaricicola taiwanensis]
MTHNRNFIIAIVLSIGVLVGWEYFVGTPTREAAVQDTPADSVTAGQPGQGAQPQTPATTPQVTPAIAPAASREEALARSQRITIDTPRVRGSVALTGGRIDDLALKDYRETVDPSSSNIVLLSPVGSAHPYYAEFGWVGSQGVPADALPSASTVWTQEGSGTLTPDTPVTLTWDNGQGLTFRREISVDRDYLFTVKDSVTNNGAAAVQLFPYALVSRHGLPQTAGYYILHEGMIGVLGDQGLQEVKYSDFEDQKAFTYQSNSGWLGITDKYWAAALVPPQQDFTGRFITGTAGGTPTYQADYLMPAQDIAAGATAEVSTRLFAGAKETNILDRYENEQSIPRFELMIDWGWFYFITKPMFYAIDFFFHFFGNFGIAILVVTVIVKLIFLPLANQSYKSMAKMKMVQPEMMKMRERYKDDRVKQQQEMMELYKREKINPVAGCWPVLIQIPVFFALYKVLFVTIEMRHAPFFGWIRDLSAPDPTTIFNLFGLIPWDPPTFLMIGIWPIIMGITMFLQMRMNPTPPDPAQAMIFTWMPVFFTFLLASFPAGLVIYWSWNNFLSILQQGLIMKRQGAKIELFDNLKGIFDRKKKTQS